MIQTHVFNTSNNNSYLFDFKEKIFFPINPNFYRVVEFEEKKATTKNSNKSEISTVDDSEYYLKKYRYLKKHGFFSINSPKNQSSTYITPKTIENQLGNLKQLVFEVTEKCNLKCVYCSYGDLYGNYERRRNKDLKFEDAKALIDFLLPYWNKEFDKFEKCIVISFYGGEPLVNVDLIKKIISYIKNLKTSKKFRFTMTTNGILLNKHINFLVENDFHLLVSLDGNEANNSYRIFQNSKFSFNNVIENLEIVKKGHPHFFENNIRFNSVLHNKNSSYDIYNFFKTRYNKVPSIAPLNDSGIKSSQIKKFNDMFRNFDEHSLVNLEDYSNIRKDLFLNMPSFSNISTFFIRNSCMFYDDFHHLFNDKTVNARPTGTCNPFSKKILLNVKKKILVCETISNKYYSGTIVNNKVKLNLENISNSFNKNISTFRNQCKKCYMKNNCSQCFYFINNFNSNPICKGFTDKKDFKLYLSSIFKYLENNPNDINTIKAEVTFDK